MIDYWVILKTIYASLTKEISAMNGGVWRAEKCLKNFLNLYTMSKVGQEAQDFINGDTLHM